jgi:hypothetical protein
VDDLGVDPPANALVVDVIAVEQCDKDIDVQQGASHRFLVTQPVDQSVGHGGPPMLEGFETIEAFRSCTRIGVLLLRQRLPGKIGQDLASGAVLAARAFLHREQYVIVQ